MSDDLKKLTDWSKLEEMMQKQDSGNGRDIKEKDFVEHCLARV